jgi:hypothetical protein
MSRRALTARLAAFMVSFLAAVPFAAFAKPPDLPADPQVNCAPQGSPKLVPTGFVNDGGVHVVSPDLPEGDEPYPRRYADWRTFVQSITLGVHPALAVLGVDTLVEWDEDELYPYSLFEDVGTWLRGRPPQPGEAEGGYGTESRVVPVEMILPVFAPAGPLTEPMEWDRSYDAPYLNELQRELLRAAVTGDKPQVEYVIEGSSREEIRVFLRLSPSPDEAAVPDRAFCKLCEGVCQALESLGICLDVDVTAPRGPRSCCELDLGGFGVRLTWEKKEAGNSLSLSVSLKKE